MSLDRTDIRTNTPRLIEHIRDNYDVSRPPTIVEPIQNSQDEYSNQMDAGTLDEGRTLRITFRVNVDERYAEITDNAGGMSREVMTDVVPEIDTTSTQKSGGGNVGSEGRGLFAVAASTEKLYIETLNTDGERLATILFPEDGTTLPDPVPPQEIANDPDEDVIQDAPQLAGPEGALLKLVGLEQSALDTLSNWDEVERVLAELFTPLFSRDDVEFVYLVEEDGEVQRHTPDFPTLHELMDEELKRIDEHEFTIGDDEYVLKDVVFGRAAGEYPWDGIAFFKGNDYFDGPVMMVDSYEPHVSSIYNDDPEMIAWCRIDECAELEDPSHQKLNIRNRQTGLRSVTQQVHANHFAEESASDEQEINRLLRDTVNQAVDSLNDEYFQDFVNLAEHGALTIDEGGSEDQLRSDDDGSLLTLNPEEYPESVGDIPIETRVYPPETPSVDEYVVHDITVRGDELDTALHLNDEILVSAIPDEIQTADFTWEAETPGWYHITASISGVPEDTDPADWTPSDDDVIDEGLIILPVDVEPRGNQPPQGNGQGGSGPGGDSDGDGDDTGEDGESDESATIFKEINEIADQNSHIFAEAFVEGGGGFTVNLNKAHPKWREIYETASREEDRKEQHQEFGSKKIARAIIEELKFVQLEEAAEEADTRDGLLDEAFDIRQEHEEIYAELESHVEEIVVG